MPGTGKLTHHRPARRRDAGVRAGRAVLRARHAPSSAPELDADWFAKHDVHVHVPAGAIPKDGPSAGITMATALVVAASPRAPVRDDVAMTGEITLTGQVLPIGGLKEKALAAQRNGITRVIAPARNEGDVEDIPEHLRDDLEFVFVEEIGEVSTWRSSAAVGQRPQALACSRSEPGIGSRQDSRRRRGRNGSQEARRPRRAVPRGAPAPYVQRVIEDDDLRDNVRARVRDRAEGLRPADQRQVADEGPRRQEAPEGAASRPPSRCATPGQALREGPKKKKRKRRGFGKLLLLAIIGAGAGDRAQRRPAQEGPRHAVRRRGGVRLHVDHVAPSDRARRCPRL